jgi:hypothetical protein
MIDGDLTPGRGAQPPVAVPPDVLELCLVFQMGRAGGGGAPSVLRVQRPVRRAEALRPGGGVRGGPWRSWRGGTWASPSRGRWGVPTLSKKQVRYACVDAYLSYRQ